MQRRFTRLTDPHWKPLPRQRHLRVWGARTATSDPEWKYVNLRRYFAFLERSVEKGTQWAVFEHNGPELWGNVSNTVEDFLFNEFRDGWLLGTKPGEPISSAAIAAP